ncbi:glycosyl transferase [Frankia sp. EI5c]|nr:glycosyl transferase [Frankia sp. EI5c]
MDTPAWSLPRQRSSSPHEPPPRGEAEKARTAEPAEPITARYRQEAADAGDEAARCARCDRRDRRVKRWIDISGALAGLVAGSPVLLLAAAAIRAEDGGPVLFRQERIGEHGRPFTIFKYRTMVTGAEHRGTGVVTYRGDPRITRVGRLLRETSLDELPQLLNVLRGDMSLVGPRPTVRSQVERYTPHQLRRLSVPPGIAGWAQVNGRNSIPWSRRIELDIWYVQNRSVRLDLAIMLRALRIILFGDGTYGAGGVNHDFDAATATATATAMATTTSTATSTATAAVPAPV